MGPSGNSTEDLDKSTSHTYPSPDTQSPNTSQPPTPQVAGQPLPRGKKARAAHPAYAVMYGGGHPPTPHTPATPDTPCANASNYPQPTSQAGTRGPAYAMAGQGQYQQGGYAVSAGMMPQQTQAISHPQPIAPAPANAPVLRPIPGGMNQPGVMPAMMQQSPGLADSDQAPTHVVGGQGRRGPLPSAPGRPPVGQGLDGKGQYQFEKTADGKFQCPHCPKTYLHQKHLKRHMLRHTGDRPYRCVLCHDTFSRSDILKRHFQKCSIRRGNPAGVSHLSHPGAHVKKAPPPAPQRTLPSPGMGDNMHHLNGSLGGLPVQGSEGMSHQYPMASMPEGDMAHLAGDHRSANGGNQDRQGMAGQYSSGVAGPMANQQMQNYPIPGGQNGMAMYGGGAGSNQQVDWTQGLGFQPSGAQTQTQDSTYDNQFNPNIGGQTQIAGKIDPNVESGRDDGITDASLDVSAADSLFFLATTPQSNCATISQQILDYLQLDEPNATSRPDENVTAFFTAENVKDFLSNYTHFHLHFPFIHVPTFRIMEAETSLLIALCCLGACYSDRVTADQVRYMVEVLQNALRTRSRITNIILMGNYGDKPEVLSKADLEELQAYVGMSSLYIWHGSPEQREMSRNIFPYLAAFIRKSGLLQVSSTSSSCPSPLHQIDFNSQAFSVTDFNWQAWVEQEKRLRIAYIVLLADFAFGLYFNQSPQFDVFEVQIPLPCDDAAWDAPTAQDCALALGLYGESAAMQKNPDGTRHPKQPDLNNVIYALLHSSWDIQPGSTNLYGKFILIHAILAVIRKAFVDGITTNGMGTPPLGDADWAMRKSASEGRLTPVEGSLGRQIAPEMLNSISMALQKFKKSWDEDMARQFPPQASPKNPRRFGFSRDGIHFYWLAKLLLKSTLDSHLRLPPEKRFFQMMHVLRSVKQWVMSDGAARGEELGSVAEIDQEYGATGESGVLDMSMLFTPLPKYVHDPRIPSVKTDTTDIDPGLVG